MGTRSFMAMLVLIIALLVVASPLMLGRTSDGVTWLAVKAHLASAPNKDQLQAQGRWNTALKKSQKQGTVSSTTMLHGQLVDAKGKTTPAPGVNSAASGNASAMLASPDGSLPLDGGSAVTVNQAVSITDQLMAAMLGMTISSATGGTTTGSSTSGSAFTNGGSNTTSSIGGYASNSATGTTCPAGTPGSASTSTTPGC